MGCARTASPAKCRTDYRRIVCRVRPASTTLTMARSYACLASTTAYTFPASQVSRASPAEMGLYLLGRCGTPPRHQKAARPANQAGLVCLVYVPRARVVAAAHRTIPAVTCAQLELSPLKALRVSRAGREHGQTQNRLRATFVRRAATALMVSSVSIVGHCLCHGRTGLGVCVLLAPKTSGKFL